MRKLGVSTVKSDEFGILDQIVMIKEAGFDCFFFSYNKDDMDIEAIKREADRVGIEIETLHLPFGGSEHGINSMWLDGQEGEEYLRSLFRKLDGCAQIGVTKAVIHSTIHSVAPPISAIGKKRFAELCSYAQDKGIHLAFENLEPLPHLHEIMSDLPKYHGFCWDCGHNLCYTPHMDMMALYGDRLICTHIHDNHGVTHPGDIHYRDDLHLLPFDGNLSWEWVAHKIVSSGYSGPLTLELSLKSKAEYARMPLQEFFNDAYRRAQKLLSMLIFD